MGLLNIDNFKVFECYKNFDCRQSKKNIVILLKKGGIKLYSVFLISESMGKNLTAIKKTLQDTLQCFFNTFLGYFETDSFQKHVLGLLYDLQFFERR